MLEDENGKKDQLPPPQEEEKGALQAEIQTEDEAATLQDGAVWTGYGHYCMVTGRCSKAEIAREFYARNALVQNPKMVQHHLSIYQKCHDAHQCR